MSTDLFNLENHVIIITGGAGLIGKAHIKKLVDIGACVVVSDINEKEALEATEFDTNNRTLVVQTDVTNPDSVENMVKKILQTKNLMIHISGTALLWARNRTPGS